MANLERAPIISDGGLALLWQFGFDGTCEPFLAMRTSLWRRPSEEVKDGLPDSRLWRRSSDSFFSAPLL
jgi:hypothetical protein